MGCIFWHTHALDGRPECSCELSLAEWFLEDGRMARDGERPHMILGSVVPAPTSLCTVTFPPDCLTMLKTVASPRPVPAAVSLRREERLEDSRAGRLVHPGAGCRRRSVRRTGRPGRPRRWRRVPRRAPRWPCESTARRGASHRARFPRG